MKAVIVGSGSYIPEIKVKNNEFNENPFSFDDGRKIQNNNEDIIQKFEQITGIKERRYVQKEQSCSEIAFIAAERALKDSGIEKESLDMVIVAHNFGDVISGSNQSDMVPSIASRVKHKLRIKNEFCIAYDLVFGCPGWVQGIIQANLFMKAGEIKTCLVIGAEVLSRVVDPFDRDTMIFADGAGATVLEFQKNEKQSGIVNFSNVSHTQIETDFLGIGESYSRFGNDTTKYIKMKGHKIYAYALSNVPKAMKHCMDKVGWTIDDIDKILIHQANEKMDEAIVERLHKLCGKKEIKPFIMPMTIEKLGNSSVATVPTLYDLLMKGEIEHHQLNKGDKILFASVGAGMNINCVAYIV